MGFPYYGHSELWFWINLILAYSGFIPLLAAIKYIWKNNAGKARLIDVAALLIFIFFLPHSLYLSLELPKHLYYAKDGVLDDFSSGGIMMFGLVSFFGFLSAALQTSLAIEFWKKYKNKGNIFVADLIIFGAVFGTLIGLQGVNFYHSFDSILAAAKNIIFLNDPSNRFIGFGPLKLGVILFLELKLAYYLTAQFIKISPGIKNS